MDQQPDAAQEPAPVAAAAAQAPRSDLNIPAFRTASSPEETAELWQRWAKQFNRKIRFFRITDVIDQLDALAIYGGEDIEELIDILPAPTDAEAQLVAANDQVTDYHKTMAKLNKHFVPMANKDRSRSQFESMEQGQLSMGQYYVKLKKQAGMCKFSDVDDAIRSKILHSMSDKKLRREAMLKEYSLTDLLKHAANKEDIERHAREIESLEERSAKVNQVYQQRPKQQQKKRQFRKPNSHPQKPENSSQHPECEYCGYRHPGPRSRCPASGQECRSCKKKGHFSVKCMLKKKQETGNPPRKNTHARQVQENTEQSDEDYAFSIADGKERPTVKVEIGGVKGKADADSCASTNVMDEHQFSTIQRASTEKLELSPADNNLFAYGQTQPLPLAGRFQATIKSITTNKTITAEFLVIKGSANSRPLLSLETSVALGVIHVTNAVVSPATHTGRYEDLKKEFKDVFSGLGKHKTITASFIVDRTIPPVALKQHRVPYNLEKQVQEEEDRLKALGVLEDVPDDVPTTWCTNPVVAPKPHKPGAIRYCSNMRVPNVAIKRPTKESLTVEDVKIKLANSSHFSILDMNEAYHQIELDETSRDMTTFHGTRGRMRYKRLNFGTVSAQDIFDQAMDDTIHGLPGVLHIRDDFIIHGSNREDHDKALHGFLTRFRECGLTLSAKKCKFGVPQIVFRTDFPQGRCQPSTKQSGSTQENGETTELIRSEIADWNGTILSSVHPEFFRDHRTIERADKG